MHEGRGRWVGSNKLVELKIKKERKKQKSKGPKSLDLTSKDRQDFCRQKEVPREDNQVKG